MTKNVEEQKKTKNIAELSSVKINEEIFTETRGEGENAFEINFIKVDDEEYRVPKCVLQDLKKILKHKPNVLEFQVLKSGEGLKTEYNVIPTLMGDTKVPPLE